GARGTGEQTVPTTGSMALGPFPGAAAAGAEMLAAAQRPEVAARRIADEDHVSAVAAVAAVGAAPWHVRLASKTDAAVAARAGLDPDLRAIVHRVTVSRFGRGG